MSSQRKVLSNTLAQFIGKFLTVVASLVIVKIITNIGTEFYGSYLTTYEFLAFFGIIADAGLFAIAVREMSKIRDKGQGTRDKNDEFILANIFSMRLLLIFGVMLLAGISAQFVPSYSPEVKLGIWITALSMGLTIIAGTLSSILQARMKIQYFSGSLVLGKIFLAAIIFVTYLKAGFTGNLDSVLGTGVFFAMLWAGVISNVIFTGLVAYFAGREIPISLGFDFSWWKKIFKISLPYGFALILQTLYLRVDVIIISILLGATSVGIYGVSTRVLESLLILGVFFGQAILPRLSAEENNHYKVQKTLKWGMEILLICSLPLIIGISKFAPQIIEILSSKEFLSTPEFFGSDKALLVLIPTIFFAYFNQLFTFTLIAKNRQKYLLLVNGIALSINAILNIILIPKFGIIAAAISTILCEIVVFCLLMKEISLHYNIMPLWTKNLRIILLANAILWVEIYLTPLKENFTLAAVVGSLTYFGILWSSRNRFLPKD